MQCTVSADDDLLVARLAVDVSTAARVDLSWCDPRGVELQRLADIPIRTDAGAVICQQSITWAKASPSSTLIARLLAVDDQGDERLLGEVHVPPHADDSWSEPPAAPLRKLGRDTPTGLLVEVIVSLV